MARRTLNRMELRRAAESAGSTGDAPAGGPQDSSAAPPKKAIKATKPRKSAKAKVPIRMRVRWAVVNDSLKQIAVFDYPHRAEADQRAADLIGRGKGHHFVRLVKEPMPEPVEVEG